MTSGNSDTYKCHKATRPRALLAVYEEKCRFDVLFCHGAILSLSLSVYLSLPHRRCSASIAIIGTFFVINKKEIAACQKAEYLPATKKAHKKKKNYGLGKNVRARTVDRL